MAHDHGHHHPIPGRVTRAFQWGIFLNLTFVAAEIAAGIRAGSLALLSDAMHNLADVGTLALSLLAFRLLRSKANDHYTYGYRKTSILVALFNSVILLFTIGWIVWEAVQKLMHPVELPGTVIAIVAGIGIVINGATALLFFRDKSSDINIRSAYLHLVSDALVSAGIVVGGVLIALSGWYWIDSILSMIVAAVILYSTWKLLMESLRLSLDGVPHDIDLEGIRKEALSVPGIRELHHVHVWALSSAENAMTAHIVLQPNVTHEEEFGIKNKLKHLMLHRNIQHVTLETENVRQGCSDDSCGASIPEAPLKHEHHR